MFSAFINSFKIKELRTRILFTAGILILCRVAANIPCPGVDTANLDVYFTKLREESATGQFLGMFDLFSGGALQHFAIGALGIMPYISASIIMQLLTPVVPSLEKLQREGEIGRGKINQYTRYLTIFEMMNSGFSASGTRFRLVHLLLLFVIFAAVTALTVLLTQGQRRVPIQMAKRIIGNKMSGGTTYMPLKVNFPGVMPIIFAGAILIFPPMLFQMIPNETVRSFAVYFQHDSYSYMTIYGLLILAFSYFWVANMFNPVQISDNLKKEGAYIPGIRPGKPTADFLDSTMTKVTFAGAVFLTALAVFPMLLTKWLKIPYQVSSFFGGTSLLIIVGVAIDTLSQMESHLVMRNYDGFLQRGRIKSRRG